jgi:hypothetical protein
MRAQTSPPKGGSTWKPTIEWGAAWTFRFYRFGKPCEQHYETEALALEAATNAIQSYNAEPIHIRAGNRVVHESVEIYEAWEKRFL